MEKRSQKGLEIVLITALVLVALCLCFGMTVIAKNRMEREEKQRQYLSGKVRVTASVRDYLNAQGYTNSGISITRHELDDGSEEYLLTVHHGKIDKLDDHSRIVLVSNLSSFSEGFGADAKMQVVLR